MWPSDTGGNCVPLWRKRKYPCVQSSVTMDNLCVAPLVWAMPDCFPVQYKFLYYDEPCFLKEGTVSSVREPGQGWGWTDRGEEESLVCSLLHHGEAEAKHIKASFRPPVWSLCVRPPLCVSRRSTVCVDEAGTSSMQRRPATFSKFGRPRLDIWGFLSVTWKSICAGGQAALWGLTVFSVYLLGMYEYLINESQTQGKSSKRAVALQS